MSSPYTPLQPLPPPQLSSDQHDTSFIPRKEFQSVSTREPSAFALLCLASSNLLRLYEFPSTVIATLRHFLDQRNAIHSEKTDLNNNFTQFELEGKIWTTKSLPTERLLVEILAIIYQSGFSFLSTIDYGRENDDRLAITFSRPSLSSELSVLSSSSSPRIPIVTPIPDQPKPRVPFALSFISGTVLRVVCPPLHSTPAILQAVRSAWPRGVHSEKKVGENSFEFKMKGYRFFQEDTFATDSLRYILSLLSSLDAQSFTLQASISLTGRSRNKDLWLFTGPPPPDTLDSPPPSIVNASNSDIHGHALAFHRRIATEPIGTPLPTMYHGRAATDNVGVGSPQYLLASPDEFGSGTLPSPGLRKAAPRAQVPVSVHDTDDIPDHEAYRANLPSKIPSGVEDMTGVGAGVPTPDVFYSTSPLGDPNSVPLPLSPPAHSSSVQTATILPQPSPRRTPPLQQSHSSSESNPEDVSDIPSPVPQDIGDELLSPDVFKDSDIYRDSQLSSNTDFSQEISIKWTGTQGESHQVQEQDRPLSEMAPKFPGGWEATPVEEKEEPTATVRSPAEVHLEQNREPLHDVCVASPEITSPAIRKSEVGLIEVVSTSPPPPLPSSANAVPQEKEREVDSGVGWVMVNIEGQGDNTLVPSFIPNSVDGGSAHTDPALASEEKQSFQSCADVPTAKAITIIENPDSKKGKSKKEPSRIKRLLSISRRDPAKTIDDTPPQEQRSRMRSLRSNGGTPEAKRNENNRRSFD
ncbi:hypothetical protein D9757_006382 [Collybiopsis confluens]|uniref:Uncharacterized protein n=1 Tax=Collybiopsis confluens TaxID=2823264 RepID=A0A8H5HGI5_9AGAR|nr:hypothetical protein D9757_006382 [Collybiopsis confluens]